MRKITLGQVITPAKVVRCGENSYPVMSMTMHDGIVLQSDRFNKSLASDDKSNYKVVYEKQLVVGFPIDEGVLYVQRCLPVGIMSPAYNVWDIDDTIVDDEYLELILHSPKAMQYYRDNLRGSTARRRSIPTSALLAFEFNLPSIDIQKEYVKIIKKQDELIVTKTEQLSSLDELVKSQFFTMFGDPIANDKCWETMTLKNMGECKNGMNFHHDEQGVEIRCLGVGDFKDYSVISETNRLPIISLDNMPSEEYLLRDGDIVFVRSNGKKTLVGRSVAVYPGDIPTTFSGFCIRFRNNCEKIIIPYLLRVLKTDSMRRKMTGRGANIQNLNQQILANLIIPVPPIELQQQFADFVEQVEKAKQVIKEQLEQLETLKKSLMQKYFG